MNEPKYKKGDLVMRNDGVIIRIGWYDPKNSLYHGHIGDSIHAGYAGSDIKCAVKIIEIPENENDGKDNK